MMHSVFLDETESTNKYLKNNMSLIGVDGVVVSTDFQTAGRGMDTNTWLSVKGLNLLFSLGLDVSFLDAGSQFALSQAVAVGMVNAMNGFIPQARLSIKWPNDIYCGDEKLAGILISNTLSGNKMDKTIIGVGLNVNQTVFPDSLPNPVSMAAVAGRQFDRHVVLDRVADTIACTVDMLKNPKGLPSISSDYVMYSYRFGIWSKYVVENKVVERRIVGFNRWGYLRLEDSDGNISEFDIKQIKFVI